jgi:hypothetical protein
MTQQKDGNRNFLVVVGLVTRIRFWWPLVKGHHKCDQGFSYVCPYICNGCDEHVMMDVDVTPNAKWGHHIGFDNLGSRYTFH